ncbi:MAG: T9SS type A sorting domain-containing protein [Calditrichaeota bacterium]|nr:T9SS type A sorting domain-containing protein [Calditrichota bacterium]MCB9391363.1 T9SS type A sorting domain-containing protein [Calditrichota bacterium]
MLTLLRTLGLLFPGVLLAGWVQIGFLTADMPEEVVLRMDGKSDRRVELRRTTDAGRTCWLSEPVSLERATSQRCAVTWERGGQSLQREFDLPMDVPTQLLLVDESSSPGKSAEPLPPRVELSISPNPFNSIASVWLTLPGSGTAKLTVFDILGREVQSLWDGPLAAGRHRLHVDGSTWASGTYFLSYSLPEGTSGVRRFQLLK